MLFIIVLVLVLAYLFVAAFFLGPRLKRVLIRHTGKPVKAKVTEVLKWKQAPRVSFSLRSSATYYLGAQRWYEISAEWTDPHTQHTYVFMSGVKRGVPGCHRDDYLEAYVSPFGKFLKLS